MSTTSPVYHGALEKVPSIIDRSLDPALRLRLEREGLSEDVRDAMTRCASAAQIIASSDVVEYLAEIIDSALADHPDLAAEFSDLRMELVRARASLSE